MDQQLIQIQLFLNTDDFYPEDHYKLIAEAKNIQLEFYAPTTLRKFYLKNVNPKVQDIQLYHGDEVRIQISFYHRYENSLYYSDIIDIGLYDSNKVSDELWVLEGTLTSEMVYYSQGVIDVYNHWQANKEANWHNLPTGITILDYISACLKYTSIIEDTPKEKVFEIDFSLIKSELDIACAFAEAFFGKRSYMGRYLDTLEDCILTLYHKRGSYFEDKTIKLKNLDKSIPDEVKAVIPELKKILKNFKFQLIEE